MQNKKHWEKIFESKEDVQKSWYQDFPVTSIQFFKELNIPKSAAIIDVGGGDSRLVDALLEEGYTNITVLDISAIAFDGVFGSNAMETAANPLKTLSQLTPPLVDLIMPRSSVFGPLG